ncbi:hypothetical protein KSB_88700 [Ktedonobacter robiniae]|uniref:Uncharacterized protein n=1 Tax=Ktedonobacter robiniae TaxID=2778365 RepID=A0ABQ3V6Z3_9CHLR|nr:hypothetical protein KSB_88700 [Ktedonobacter robiniae]
MGALSSQFTDEIKLVAHPVGVTMKWYPTPQKHSHIGDAAPVWLCHIKTFRSLSGKGGNLGKKALL